MVSCFIYRFVTYRTIGEAWTRKKLRTTKGDYRINQWFSSIVSLFKMRTSFKGKNLLPGEGANSFLYEKFLIVRKLKFITLSDLPWMLLFLLRTCVTCVMSAKPICTHVIFFAYFKLLTHKVRHWMQQIAISNFTAYSKSTNKACWQTILMK